MLRLLIGDDPVLDAGPGPHRLHDASPRDRPGQVEDSDKDVHTSIKTAESIFEMSAFLWGKIPVEPAQRDVWIEGEARRGQGQADCTGPSTGKPSEVVQGLPVSYDGA